MSNAIAVRAQKMLDRAKVQCMLQPDTMFFTAVGFRLKVEITEAIPTAAVDGTNIFLNPHWWTQWTDRQRIGVYLHEIMHVVYEHMFVCEENNLQLKRHNDACDYYINNDLDNRGFDLPPGLLDHQYDGMSSMEIYHALPECPGSPDGTGDLIYPKESKAEDAKTQQTREEIKNILVNAVAQAEAANQAGSIPGDVKRRIKELMQPKLPWRTMLEKFLTGYNKDDYSYKKPNRRFMPEFYLPTLHSEALDHIAVAVDTSGSVTDEDFTTFLSEINFILTDMKPKRLTVIDFDTSIKDIHELEPDDSIQSVNFTGYGGTNIKPVIKWAEDNQPTAMVIFTDGHFRKHDPKEHIELLWCIYRNPRFKSKVGTITYFD